MPLKRFGLNLRPILSRGIFCRPLIFLRSQSSDIVKKEPGRDSKKDDLENMRHKGRVAVMVAATQGMGLAMTERVLQDGARAIVSSRSPKNVEYAIDHLYKLGYGSDRVIGMARHGAIRDHFKDLLVETKNAFGAVDYLYQGTGANPGKWLPILLISPSIWKKLFDSNVKCGWMSCQEVYKYMDGKKHGSILFDGSISSYISVFQGRLGGYIITKAILLGLTKTMAEELAPYGIRVNTIVPGIFETKFATILTEEDFLREALCNEALLKRIGQPSELGGVASLLFSDDASYLTSENIVVAGGDRSRI